MFEKIFLMISIIKPYKTIKFLWKKTGFRGRPFLIITKEQLQLYLQYNFTFPKIAKILLVCESTIKRRFQEFGLSVGDTYSDISDGELDSVIRNNISKFPNCAYSGMNGLHLSQSLRITEKRIRNSIKRVDPEGLFVRNLQIKVVQRRSYKVPGILAFWHIDGYHKVIRWVVRGSFSVCINRRSTLLPTMFFLYFVFVDKS